MKTNQAAQNFIDYHKANSKKKLRCIITITSLMKSSFAQITQETD